MKKYLSIMTVFAIAISLMCGCVPDTEHDAEIKDAENIVEQPTTTTDNSHEEIQQTDAKDDIVIDETESTEHSDALDITEPTANTTTPSDSRFILSFIINDNEYKLGMVCGSMLDDFADVEVVDGYRYKDGSIPVFEKITLKLTDDKNNQFIIAVRNDEDRAIAIEDCVLHEVLVKDTDVDDMSVFKVGGVIEGDAPLASWINKFGSNYKQYTSSLLTAYSWKLSDHCWVDLYTDVETHDVLFVQLMTY